MWAATAATAQANIDIVFDYTYDSGNFFDSTRISVLEAAAAVFETRLQDHLTAINSGAGGAFNAQFFNPSNVGSTVTLNNFSVADNVVKVFVGASNLNGPLGVGGGGGFSGSGTQAFLDNAASRGQVGALANFETDFGPWGGAISFSNAIAWHFDTSPGTVEPMGGAFDFYSVAVHELGHVLGIGTAASWQSRVQGSNFVGSAVGAGGAGTRPLSGDLGHWAVNTQSTVGPATQEAAMTPSISINQRKYFTTLDYAGLQDIGWQVSAVPEPATWLMWGAGGAVLLGLRRRTARA